MNCKNCKMTDEYCASGDCLHDKTNYDILKEYEANKTPVPSYEEWEKLNWYAGNGVEENQELKMENAQLKERVSKLEKMQYSYTPEEWNTMLRTVNRTKEKNAQLKELLKECKNILEEQTFRRNTILETDETLRTRIIKKAEILTKIYEVLK